MKVKTATEYFTLPREKRERHVWYWPFGPWYIEPDSLVVSSTLELREHTDNWSLLYKGLKKEYPIQFRLREPSQIPIIHSICKRYWLFNEHYWYPMKCWFFPRNNNIKKVIPNVWIDKADLIRNVAFACFTEAYKESNENNNWDLDPNSMPAELYSFWSKKKQEWDQNFNWVTIIRNEKLEEIKKAITNNDSNLITQLEQELAKEDERVLYWIITHRLDLDL